MRNLPQGVDSSCLDGGPGGGIPPKSQIPLLDKSVYTSGFAKNNTKSCNNRIYHFHVSELLNLILGCPGGCQNKSAHLGQPGYNYNMQSRVFTAS